MQKKKKERREREGKRERTSEQTLGEWEGEVNKREEEGERKENSFRVEGETESIHTLVLSTFLSLLISYSFSKST